MSVAIVVYVRTSGSRPTGRTPRCWAAQRPVTAFVGFARRPEAKRRADADAYDHVAEATEVEHAEAVRSLKDNSQEEAHEDRREHGTDLSVPLRDEGEAEGDPPSTQTVYTNNAALHKAALRSSRSLDLRG
jgi:hypothetical protein